MISVIVPTLNAEATLAGTLEALAPARGDGLIGQIVVSDGGSQDDTQRLASEAGAIVVEGPSGRGGQLARGADAASGSWLLFLHADTRPGSGWREAIATHLAESEACAGVFHLRFDDAARQARRLERIVAWRTRALGLPYGDQGLLISRALYDQVGGFRPLVLMEDVAMSRALGRDRIELLDAEMITASDRYRRGYLVRSARNMICLGLYFAGVPPTVLQRIYG